MRRLFRATKNKISAFLDDVAIKSCLRNQNAARGSLLVWVDSGFLDFSRLHAGIGFGMALRGYRPHFIVCDSICDGACIPSTDAPHWASADEADCVSCVRRREELFQKFGMGYTLLSSYLNEEDLEKVQQVENEASRYIEAADIDGLYGLDVDGCNVGADIFSTVIRYYKKDDTSSFQPEIVRRYARVASITAIVFKKAIARQSPTHLFIPHNQYSPAGPAVRIARQLGFPYFTYAGHHRGGIVYKTIMPSDVCESAFAVSDTRWKDLCSKEFTSSQHEDIVEMFRQRYQDFSCQDMQFLRSMGVTEKNSLECINDKEKKVFAIFTHICWDNAFGFGASPFKTFGDWIDFTIETIINVPEVHWIIKIHPAEYYSEAERSLGAGVFAHIKNKYPVLPDHIEVIPPDAAINPYDFMRKIDGVISCCGTSGLEAAVLGKIVINGAAGYYSGCGFSYDPMLDGGLQEYAAILKRAAELPKPSLRQCELAKIFFHYFFFKRSCPETSYAADYGVVVDNPAQFSKFLPGQNISIDTICDGIVARADIDF